MRWEASAWTIAATRSVSCAGNSEPAGHERRITPSQRSSARANPRTGSRVLSHPREPSHRHVLERLPDARTTLIGGNPRQPRMHLIQVPGLAQGVDQHVVVDRTQAPVELFAMDSFQDREPVEPA